MIIQDTLHHEIANPDNLLYTNARDDAALKVLAKENAATLGQLEQVLTRNLANAEEGSVRVSAKVKGLWTAKLETVRALLTVFNDAESGGAELDATKKEIRLEFFKNAHRAWEVNLGEVLTQLNKEIVGPLTLGRQNSTKVLLTFGS